MFQGRLDTDEIWRNSSVWFFFLKGGGLLYRLITRNLFFFQILLDSISYPLPSEILNVRSLNRDEENKNFYIFVVTIVKVLSMIRGITKRRLKFRVK